MTQPKIEPRDAKRFTDAYKRKELWTANLLNEETLDLIDSIYIIAYDKERALDDAYVQFTLRHGVPEEICAIIQVVQAEF